MKSRLLYRSLRFARIFVSAAVTTIVVAGALLPGTTVATAGKAIHNMQPLTACLAVSAVWILIWTITTMLAGRIFCSTACPLGTLQDLIARLAAKPFFSRPSRYRYTSGILTLRVLALLICAEGAAMGVTLVLTALNPYDDFMRIVAIFGTLSAGVWCVGLSVLAATWLLTVHGRGRMLCNTLCPVGAAMGALGTVALMRFDINPDLCIHCGACEHVCKARCIDSDKSLVCDSRCVVCFNCVNVCPNNAITWRTGRHRLQWPLLQRTVKTAGAANIAPIAQHSTMRKQLSTTTPKLKNTTQRNTKK